MPISSVKIKMILGGSCCAKEDAAAIRRENRALNLRMALTGRFKRVVKNKSMCEGGQLNVKGIEP